MKIPSKISTQLTYQLIKLFKIDKALANQLKKLNKNSFKA